MQRTAHPDEGGDLPRIAAGDLPRIAAPAFLITSLPNMGAFLIWDLPRVAPKLIAEGHRDADARTQVRQQQPEREQLADGDRKDDACMGTM